MKTVFARLRGELLFLIPMAVAICVLSVALIVQVKEDLYSSRSMSNDLLAKDQSLAIHISYPADLRVESTKEPGWPVTIWLESSQAITATQSSSYTITLGQSGGILFVDADGKPSMHQVILKTGNKPQESGVIYIRPIPQQNSSQAKLYIQLLDSNAKLTKTTSFDIQIEDRSASIWRYLIGHLALQIALPISLAVAFTGWIWDSNKRHRDRLDRERHEHIQNVRGLSDHDLQLALGQYTLLRQQSLDEHWDSSSLNALHDLQLSLSNRAAELWRLVDYALVQEDRSRAQTILRHLEHLYGNSDEYSQENERVKRIRQVFEDMC